MSGTIKPGDLIAYHSNASSGLFLVLNVSDAAVEANPINATSAEGSSRRIELDEITTWIPCSGTPNLSRVSSRAEPVNLRPTMPAPIEVRDDPYADFEPGVNEHGDRRPLASLCTVGVVAPSAKQTEIRMLRQPKRHPNGQSSRAPGIPVIYMLTNGVTYMTPEDAAIYLSATPGAQPAKGLRLPLTDSWSVEHREDVARQERKSERDAERQANRMRREIGVKS